MSEERVILDIEKLTSIEVLEFYVSCNISSISSTYAFNLGREFIYSFNLIKTYFYDASSLSAIELEKIPNYFKLYDACGISEEILRMSKEELLELLDIEYYKISGG